MTTYIALFSLTEAGIKAAKDSPRRLDAAKRLLADMGGEMKQFLQALSRELNWPREVSTTQFEFMRLSQLATSGKHLLGRRGAPDEM